MTENTTLHLNPTERDAVIGALRAQLARARMTQSDKDLRYRIIDRLEGRPPLPPLPPRRHPLRKRWTW